MWFVSDSIEQPLTYWNVRFLFFTLDLNIMCYVKATFWQKFSSRFQIAFQGSIFQVR